MKNQSSKFVPQKWLHLADYTTRRQPESQKIVWTGASLIISPYLGRYMSWSPPSSPGFVWILNSQRNSRLQGAVGTSVYNANPGGFVTAMQWLKRKLMRSFRTDDFKVSVSFTSSQSLNSVFGGTRMGTETLLQNSVIPRYYSEGIVLHAI